MKQIKPNMLCEVLPGNIRNTGKLVFTLRVAVPGELLPNGHHCAPRKDVILWLVSGHGLYHRCSKAPGMPKSAEIGPYDWSLIQERHLRPISDPDIDLSKETEDELNKTLVRQRATVSRSA